MIHKIIKFLFYMIGAIYFLFNVNRALEQERDTFILICYASCGLICIAGMIYSVSKNNHTPHGKK